MAPTNVTRVLAFLMISFFSVSCATYQFRSDYRDANSLLHETGKLETKPFLKAHLRNGDVIILTDSWTVDTAGKYLSGNGITYDFSRSRLDSGYVSIPFSNIAIFETNTKIIHPEAGRLTALGILTGIDIVFGIICITNPKACFGSCPTFYIHPDQNFHYADAEAFSNAIAPSLECNDIDALGDETFAGGRFLLTMKNEALETHCVREVKLLACPSPEDAPVVQTTDNHFYQIRASYPVSEASAAEGIVTNLLETRDQQERFSLADDKNMRSKEEIILNFENVKNPGQLGLLLHFRQTLMTTYLIYSALGYMGDQVSDGIAHFETNPALMKNLNEGIRKQLGDIEVHCWNEKTRNWEYQGGFFEVGPIAINRQCHPVHTDGSSITVRLKLVMNKGLWRIDYASLISLGQEIKPVEIRPDSILKTGLPQEPDIKQRTEPGELLISMPGDQYALYFSLPAEEQRYSLFLSAKGYYLEWMRESWLREKNPAKLRQMVIRPKRYLKSEIKKYKRYESTMEPAFWDSKVAPGTFSFNSR